jgi:hypothetical protein
VETYLHPSLSPQEWHGRISGPRHYSDLPVRRLFEKLREKQSDVFGLVAIFPAFAISGPDRVGVAVGVDGLRES